MKLHRWSIQPNIHSISPPMDEGCIVGCCDMMRKKTIVCEKKMAFFKII
jgi:hypothetical protein